MRFILSNRQSCLFIYHLVLWSIFNLLHISSGSPFLLSRVSSYFNFALVYYICSSWDKWFRLYQHRSIGLTVRVFTKGSRDWGSVPGQVKPKTQRMVLDVALLNTHHYKVQVEESTPGKWAAPFSTPPCRSYWKGSLRFPSSTVANFT